MTVSEYCFNTYNRAPTLTPEPDLAAQVEAAGAAGFGGIGPDLGSIDSYCAAGHDLAELADLIAAHGLRCFELTALHLDRDPRWAPEAMAHLTRAVQALRPKYVIAVVDCDPDAAVAPLREAGDRLGELGSAIAVEFVPYSSVRTIDQARSLLNAAAVPGAGVLVDTWHFFRSGALWGELEALPLDEVAYVHFDDALAPITEDMSYETLHRRVMPGQGVFDLSGFCARWEAKGYNGVVSVEVLSQDLRPLEPAVVARRAMEATRAYWA